MPAYAFQPSSYPLHYPPEIAAIIAGFVGEDSFVGDGAYYSESRNSGLLQLALVSAVWASAAVPLLYSDLKLQWRASSGLLLLETLRKRPELLARIRRVEVAYPTRWMLVCALEEVTSYFSVEEFQQKWDALSEAERGEVGIGEEAYDDWRTGLDYVAAREAFDSGPDSPWGGEDVDDEAVKVGTRAFWHLIAQLPRLQHLAGENITFLVPEDDKSALDVVLKGLASFVIQSSTEYTATPPLAALAAAENIRSLRISSHDLTSFPTTPGNMPFPHLRHLRVIAWRSGNDAPSWTAQGSQLSEACPVLDLALYAKDSLESLIFEPPWLSTIHRDPRTNNRLVGEALRLLPHLRTLVLPPSDTDPPLPGGTPSNPRNRSLAGEYPDVFLSALASSSLEHFEIGDIPDAKLLAALPISLISLTLNPRNGAEAPWLFEAMLDQFVKVVLKVKARLPALALVTLDCYKSGGNVSRPLDPAWDLLNEQSAFFPRPSEEYKMWREERQLRREKVAADVGVCLRSRPEGR
ncbi:hypothetical protein RQP46_004234 [Phenoliferia psychrophenolica]